MNKIKDIIYDKSDIIIALLILAIAALIIFWRLGIILEYPKEIVGTNDTGNVLTDPSDITDEDLADDDDLTDDNADQDGQTDAGTQDDTKTQGQDQTDSQTQTQDQDQSSQGQSQTSQDDTNDNATSDSTQDETSSDSGKLWDGGKLTRDYEVTITGTTASAAVQSLVDAGIFEDYAEYKKICDENKYDDEKMRAGVFKFKKGATKLDIIKAVNWTNG